MTPASVVRRFTDHLSTGALELYQGGTREPGGVPHDLWVTLAVAALGSKLDVAGFLAVQLAAHYDRGCRLGLLGVGVLAPPRLIALSPLCNGCDRPFARTSARSPEADHVDCRAATVRPRTGIVLYALTAKPMDEVLAGGIGAVREGADFPLTARR